MLEEKGRRGKRENEGHISAREKKKRYYYLLIGSNKQSEQSSLALGATSSPVQQAQTHTC